MRRKRRSANELNRTVKTNLRGVRKPRSIKRNGCARS